MSSRKKTRRGGSLRPQLEPTGSALEQDMFGGMVPADTKTVQLCRQVEEAISYALVSATSALLRDLYVVRVEPVKGAAVVRVLVCMEGARNNDNYERTLEALERARGYLRGEVARTINRKRAPTLQYALLPVLATDPLAEVSDDERR